MSGDRDLSQARIKPGYMLTPEDVSEPRMSTQDWADFEEGIRLFNKGEYWESHEAWEFVWKRCEEPPRVFFQALIQLAAAYHQLNRNIYHGVVKHFRNAETKLRPFPDGFLGVELTPIKQALSAGEAEVVRLGKDNLGDFEPDLICQIRYTRVFE